MTPKERIGVGAFFAVTGIAIIILSIYSGNHALIAVCYALGSVVAGSGFVVLHANMGRIK